MASFKRHDGFKLVTEGEVEGRKGENATFPCHLSAETSAVSMTIRWFKESKCIYVYRNGAEQEVTRYKNRLTVNKQEMQKGNVSLILRGFRLTDDSGVFICQVQHGDQHEEVPVGVGYVGKGKAKKYVREETVKEKNDRMETAHLLEREGMEERNTQKQKLTQDLLELTAQLKERDNQVENLTVQLEKKDEELRMMKKEKDDIITENLERELQNSSKVPQSPLKFTVQLAQNKNQLKKKDEELKMMKMEKDNVITEKTILERELQNSTKEVQERKTQQQKKNQDLLKLTVQLTQKECQLEKKHEELRMMKKETTPEKMNLGVKGLQITLTADMKANFVKKNRTDLIQRVTEVLGVVDHLLGEGILKESTYNEIRAEKTREDKVRMLHDMICLKGRKAMSAFYDGLQKCEPFLIDDLGTPC